MNRNLIIIGGLAVILIAGGAWYFVSGQSAQNNQAIEVEEQKVEENLPSATPAAQITNETTDSAVEGNVKKFTVEGNTNLRFTPNQISVNKGDTVSITFKNVGGKHDFRIDEFGVTTSILETGEEETVEFVSDKLGTYKFYCSLPGHRAAGMKGTLVVK